MTIEDVCRIAGVTIDELGEENRVISLTGEDVDTLPQGLCVYGLDLKGCPNLKSLPEDLQIRYLSVLDCPNLTSLPQHLELDYLYLVNSDIKDIPETSLCNCELVLIGCHNIEKLPSGCVEFKYDCYLEDCPKLKELPMIKHIGGRLGIAQGTGIENLPENLRIDGELWAVVSHLKSIPNSVYIGGSIFLAGSRNFKQLPEDLIVNGELDISSTLMSNLPPNMKVKGVLNIEDTLICSLPDNLIVEGGIRRNPPINIYIDLKR